VTAVVEVPQVFDDRSFEQLAAGFAAVGDEGRVLVDAHATEWASPFGLVSLLCLGQTLLERLGTRPLLTVPSDRDVTHYWARAGFFQEAEALFEIHGAVPKLRQPPESTVLLEVTPVRVAGDVHKVVDRIQDRAAAILTAELGLEARSTIGFGMALSEACQNIVEHAGTGGWVAVQAYSWRRRLGRRVVVIAVADGGVGFRHSLEPTAAKRAGERWGDGAALEAALIQGVSRFREPGRGQGFRGIRKFLDHWEGKISIRSGTARIAMIRPWDEDVPLREGLAPFPGAQLQLVVPALEREGR
jgi:anti-sigma regulatory factor (Ser/Thr protein kinase)